MRFAAPRALAGPRARLWRTMEAAWGRDVLPSAGTGHGSPSFASRSVPMRLTDWITLPLVLALGRVAGVHRGRRHGLRAVLRPVAHLPALRRRGRRETALPNLPNYAVAELKSRVNRWECESRRSHVSHPGG